MRMCARLRRTLLLAGVGAGLLISAPGARADGNLNNVNHIIIVMQENHSYDNYFGVLGYVPNSPYHNAASRRGCNAADTACVDGLTCKTPSNTGLLTCKTRTGATSRATYRRSTIPGCAPVRTSTTAGTAATRRATSSGSTTCCTRARTTGSSG